MGDFMHKAGLFIFPILLSSFTADGTEMLLERGNGEVVSLEVDEMTTVHALFQEAKLLAEGDSGVILAGFVPKLSFENPSAKAFVDKRDYYRPMTKVELDAIRFIVLTLGNEPLYKLYKYESDMKKAGDKFSTVHPLNLWMEIFTTKDTTSAIFNARNRKLVWKPFMKGMAESLQEAYDGNNLKEEYVLDFAKKVGIDPDLVRKPLYAQDWSGFVQALLDNTKKSGKDDRYDM